MVRYSDGVVKPTTVLGAIDGGGAGLDGGVDDFRQIIRFACGRHFRGENSTSST